MKQVELWGHLKLKSAPNNSGWIRVNFRLNQYIAKKFYAYKI